MTSTKITDQPVSTDVQMKEKDATEEPPPKHADLLTLEDLRDQVNQIERSVILKDVLILSRVLRALCSIRKRLNRNVVNHIITGFYTNSADSESKHAISKILAKVSDSSAELQKFNFVYRPKSAAGSRSLSSGPAGRALSPETDVYLQLLVLVFLLDSKESASAVVCADQLMNKVSSLNRRTLDRLAARCYFFYSRAYEAVDQLNDIRGKLHAWLRNCTLRSDYEGTAVLLNLLLRNYLHYNLYDQADKLIAKSSFPDAASNNEWARFLYYMGRIKATQLDYTQAQKQLLQALRKAGQHHGSLGFRQTVQKLAVTVELLLGEIPDRATFRIPAMVKTLRPYFYLTQAVRSGNTARFEEVKKQYEEKFIREHTYNLITRLHHNVIKTGVRMISLSYSRISLQDVAQKLQMGSPEDAEYIMAKAIRDGVIEAQIDHQRGFVQSKERIDIYGTREPLDAFHQRIQFCLEIHNQSVKAMRYPDKKYNEDMETAEERREREQQELESAKEMADDDYDGFP